VIRVPCEIEWCKSHNSEHIIYTFDDTPKAVVEAFRRVCRPDVDRLPLVSGETRQIKQIVSQLPHPVFISSSQSTD
jgi:hypothetical protein